MNRHYLSGLSNTSTIFFHTPSHYLPDFFYYPLCIGHYFCNIPYKVVRNQYDSFLFLYTKSGKGMVAVGDEQKEQNPGDVCLIDCYRPHSYWAMGEWELFWIHADGGASRSYFDLLTDDHCFHISLKTLHSANPSDGSPSEQAHPLSNDYEQQFRQVWLKIQNVLIGQEALQAPLLSQYIQELFTILTLVREENQDPYTVDYVDSTLKYIRKHLDEPLTIKKLADRISLSPFYFSRKFKEKTGYAPYDYILTSRLNLARYYLKSSQDTVKNIAYSCGFKSEHSFCTAFKNATGMTPTEFRNCPTR